MKFKVGDKVKLAPPEHLLSSKVGTVTELTGDSEFPIEVTWPNEEGGFDITEIYPEERLVLADG